MSHLLVSIYDDQLRAGEVLATLRREGVNELPDVEDAVAVTKGDDLQLKLQETTLLTGGPGSPGGEVWRPLLGALLLGNTIPTEAGAGESVSAYGVDDAFVSRLQTELQPDTSALFMLVRRVLPEDAVTAVGRHGGTVLETALAPDAEARLMLQSREPWTIDWGE
jgi:uncharacterized membrane protein